MFENDLAIPFGGKEETTVSKEPINVGKDYELIMSIDINGHSFSVKLYDANKRLSVPKELSNIGNKTGASLLKSWLKDNHSNRMKGGLEIWFKKIDAYLATITRL